MEAITQYQTAVIDPAACAVRFESPRPSTARWTFGAAAFLLLLVGASYASAANKGPASQPLVPSQQISNLGQ
jgi:hypothetical protein